jgi:hypothetical protein
MNERTQIIINAMLIGSMFALLLYGMFSTTQEESPKFQVVDKYENCDVIRYTDTTQRWNYFLKCQ